ncbi:hypothetical protein AB3Z07_13830 [Metabacillus halosaccharovorans]|uniref:hypothetical protein n=1 Tax=Metabacillus halosaccharovorans TaxID=930124 RepID=UPI0034CE6986
MIDVNDIKERKKLRLEILEQLYNLYFNSSTQNQSLTGNKEELFGVRNSEKHLAYHYLVTGGFIEIDSTDAHSAVTITVKGIDYIETIYEEKN